MKKINLMNKIKGTSKNTLWLLFERICKLAIGFFVYALIARYLGPEDFGLINYAIAIVFIVGAFAPLGLLGLVVRELVKFPEDKNLLLGTTLLARMLTGILSIVLLQTILFFIMPDENLLRILILIISLRLIADSFETVDLWFQAEIKGKLTAKSKITAVITTSLLHLLLIYYEASILLFGAVIALEFFIAYSLMMAYYLKEYKNQGVWEFNFLKLKSLLKESWPLIFSSVASMIYLKSDQIMVRELISDYETGIYSAAARLSEVWFFVPVAIVTSLYPGLVKSKLKSEVLYKQKLQSTYNFLAIIALMLAVITTIIAEPLVTIAFGEEYKNAALILKIHIWTAIFVFLRALLSKWLINEQLLIFSLISHGMGAVGNILLNLLLIPIYGGVGAAVATITSFSISTVIFTFFFTKTRPAGIMMLKAIVSPITITIKKIKKVGVLK